MDKQETIAPNFHYLAMLRNNCGDVPLYLGDDEQDVFDFASNIDWSLMDTPLAGILELSDTKSPVCICVITFRDGVPCSRVVVRNFDDEEDGESGQFSEPNPDPSLKVN